MHTGICSQKEMAAVANKHIIHKCGSQRLYGSVCNLSVCAEQCATPAAFYVFTVCNSCSYILVRLVWITVFLPCLYSAGMKMYGFMLLV